MFLKNKGHFLIRDILDLLDNKEGFLTTTEIVHQLIYPTVNSVKNTCRYLKGMICELYSPEEIEFTISRRGGVKMERKTVNLKSLTQAINEESIPYKVILKIFMERDFFALDFCEENFISRSTLVRKVKQNNSLFEKYGLKVSISNRLKLIGDESKIRLYHFIFLALNYETLNDFLFYQQAKPYLIETNRIFHYLNIPLTENEFEFLAIWLFVTQHAIEDKHLLTEDNTLLPFLDYYEFTEKPQFLTEWTENDWQLFLLFLYSLDYLSLKKNVQVKEPNPFAGEINQWITCFEQHYFPMTDKQRLEITEILTKQLQCDAMAKLESTVIGYLKNLDIARLQGKFPLYFARFEKFWQDLVQINPSYAIRPSIRRNSLLNCIYLVKLTTFIPEITIFVCTNTSRMHRNLLKEEISVNLSDRFIKFVDDIHLADIIVTNINFLENVSSQQEIVEIRPTLPEIDLSRIKYAIERQTTL